MLFAPKLIGTHPLEDKALEADWKNCRKIGRCGVGREAVYLGTTYVPRCFYAPVRDVKRVFKRVAMSKGGFTGQGSFGALAYVVVQLKNGKEKQCSFRTEPQADEFLEAFSHAHPDIPTLSAKGEQALARAEAEERARFDRELTPDAENSVAELQKAREVLEERAALYRDLAFAARDKRIVENITPGRRAAGMAIALGSLAAIILGFIFWRRGSNIAGMVALFGLAGVFFALTTGTLPTRRNTRGYTQTQWEKAVEAMAGYLAGREGFPLPPQFAHPTVIDRMIRVIREGRARSAEEAYRVMKADLRKLNNTVKVSQQEYDEVVAVKPLFLACDYADELPRSGKDAQ